MLEILERSNILDFKAGFKNLNRLASIPWAALCFMFHAHCHKAKMPSN